MSRKVNVDGRQLRPNWFLFADMLNNVFNCEAGTKAKQFAWVDWVSPEISYLPCILVELNKRNRPISLQNPQRKNKCRRKIAIQMFNTAVYLTSPSDRPGCKTLLKPSALRELTVFKKLGYEVFVVDVPPSFDRGDKFRVNLERRAVELAGILTRRVPNLE